MLPVAWRGQTAILAKAPEEFESYLTSLFLDIALDGIILHDSDGYFQQLRETFDACPIVRSFIVSPFPPFPENTKAVPEK
jgi:hypothetical protein